MGSEKTPRELELNDDGQALCPNCGKAVWPLEPEDLDHDDACKHLLYAWTDLEGMGYIWSHPLLDVGEQGAEDDEAREASEVEGDAPASIAEELCKSHGCKFHEYRIESSPVDFTLIGVADKELPRT